MADYNNVVRRRIEAFRSDEIVLDPKDLRQVSQEAGALGIEVAPIATSVRLGLAQYKLRRLEAGVAALGPDLVNRVKAAAVGTYLEGEQPSDLDLLLFHLREKSAAKYAGYKPVVAKIRTYENIEGSPYSGGSVGDPQPVKAFKLPERSPSKRRRPRIGILDTPIHPHPQFAGRYLIASDKGLLVERPKQVSFSGHAIFVASVAARQAPDAEFVIYPVLDETTLTTNSWDLATTMVDALDDDLDMMIIALGGATADGREPLALARACERTSGIVKVAALGNNGQNKAAAPKGTQFSELPANTPIWPAASSTVIAVGARDESDRAAYFSPTLEEAPWTDCTAPGTNLEGLFLPGQVWMADLDVRKGAIKVSDRWADFPAPGHATWSGTSFAAAYAGGAIAQQAYAEGITVRELAQTLFGEDREKTPTTYDGAPRTGLDALDIVRFP
ncbi:S8/S53 family peptidase [Nonomuraea gerenzanensis]|uniref:Peptidase S8 and S53, subtilisin, kexin, sedolisin n=1 Tax=Nonomuraea gerenzanensis TaxID=93944 RepID=A0A1M4EGE0_9ACTN|nr:S8/S53 family peptidase [Nonomuraea gerenzanensis]UBU09384.1 S8/S53 family peptidase [Nonomuraea gerenzanensis]SBO97796.1 peptidase S8 and S53, subtilisin, kexin, sedolisin [Nonomuraea gerenzanensis]